MVLCSEIRRESSELEEPGLDNPWGGVAVVDHLAVRLHTQAGVREQTFSDSIENWTQYWLGLRSVLNKAHIDPI